MAAVTLVDRNPTIPSHHVDCVVGTCLDRLTDRIATLACSHIFCEGCLRQWAQNIATCPICREPFNATNLTGFVGEQTFTNFDSNTDGDAALALALSFELSEEQDPVFSEMPNSTAEKYGIASFLAVLVALFIVAITFTSMVQI